MFDGFSDSTTADIITYFFVAALPVCLYSATEEVQSEIKEHHVRVWQDTQKQSY